jgi:hypothetical protein
MGKFWITEADGACARESGRCQLVAARRVGRETESGEALAIAALVAEQTDGPSLQIIGATNKSQLAGLDGLAEDL